MKIILHPKEICDSIRSDILKPDFMKKYSNILEEKYGHLHAKGSLIRTADIFKKFDENCIIYTCQLQEEEVTGISILHLHQGKYKDPWIQDFVLIEYVRMKAGFNLKGQVKSYRKQYFIFE